MDKLQNQNSHQLIQCRYNNNNNNNNSNNNNNNRLTEYFNLDNRIDDPLREPEVTMNLNEGSAQLSFHPLEEPEEDLFDYEIDTSYQDMNTESEEQVVPSSQLSNSYKYPDELTISDDEVDEGIFEDEPVSNLVLPDDNNRYNSQPP
ncbi:conserved oligomeric Golgi complex subunit 8-like [Bombus affinis]|uniref:conserved oligomeric Golgi complex subunit 8-like n=1 Tax=Bombus affinis TaxID=309941 RepID=UPI002128AB50|nr:conserved oligomeric Golgi complex subunit 8-like [Bombus affinis]XP_050576122.1 conserved oligomeric Golgi complex subunit 8-like [Bombus affinis]